jgi:hypothetical protein
MNCRFQYVTRGLHGRASFPYYAHKPKTLALDIGCRKERPAIERNRGIGRESDTSNDQ